MGSDRDKMLKSGARYYWPVLGAGLLSENDPIFATPADRFLQGQGP
jgi:hypothetical protein